MYLAFLVQPTAQDSDAAKRCYVFSKKQNKNKTKTDNITLETKTCPDSGGPESWPSIGFVGADYLGL